MSHVQRPETAERPFGMPAQRTPVQFDPETGGLRIGVHERRVDPSQPSSVYNAYLSLLYAVRGAQPGQQLPLRSADLEALLLIVGDDPATIEQRLVGLMGCTAEEARALSGILLRHRKLTATLGIAATLSLGAAAVVGDPAADPPARGAATSSAVAPAHTDAALENRRAIEPEPAAPTAPGLVPSGTTSVVVAEAEAPPAAPAPARRAVRRAVRRAPAAAPASVAVAPAPAAPAPAPVVAAPAPAVPVDAAPVGESAPAPVDAAPAPPADDAPPPAQDQLPDAGIGDPAYEEAVPPEEIGGIADPSIGHDEPVAQPDGALPFPHAPRVGVVLDPEPAAPVVEPEAPAPVDAEVPAVEPGPDAPADDEGSSAGDEPKA